VTTILAENLGFSAGNFKFKKKKFNLTCQICNLKFVTKNENPANVFKPIEMFCYLLKAEVYKDNWIAKNLKQLE